MAAMLPWAAMRVEVGRSSAARHGALAEALPERGGAYVLELRLRRSRWLDVGRLGRMRFPRGLLRYYGSAQGPGGLRGRVGRHLRSALGEGRRHWHIDALLHSEAKLVAVELYEGLEAEHELVARDLALGAEVPISGFGASDCRRCLAHLLLVSD